MKKRIIALFLAVIMVCTLMPAYAFAADTTASGKDGNISWSLSGGTLTISGSGAMNNHANKSYSGRYATDAPWGKYYSAINTLEIGSGVTSIGNYAFSGCYFSSVTIPSTVKSIGDDAFDNCLRLKSVTIPASVTSIGASAFDSCRSLTSVSIPTSVTSLGDAAFNACSALKSISIPKSVTDIGNYTFTDCTSLSSVSIPSSVTKIGTAVFEGCTALKSITVPSGVKSIGLQAFAYCRNLQSITLPESLTSVKEYAFYDCRNLDDVYFKGTESQWKKLSIGLNNEDLTDADLHIQHTHSYKTTIVKPTASKQGYTLHKCSCGYSYKDKYTIAAPTVTLSNVASSGKIKLTWGKIAGADKYYVYRSTDGKSYEFYAGTSKTYYTDSKATAGKKYYYKVKAVKVSDDNKKTFSANSSSHYRTCDLARPVVKITTSKGDPKLTWSKITGAKKYEIYRATSKSGEYTKMYTTTKTSYTNTSAKAGKTYYYKVKAISSTSAANSAYSTVVSIKAK